MKIERVFELLNFRKWFNRKYLFYWIIAAGIILIAGFIFFRGEGKEETLVVKRGEFLQQVAVSGTVVPVEEVSIAVSQGGPVDSVYIKVGDTVTEEDELIALDTAAIRANLLSARADVALKRAEIQNKEVNIDKITKEQDTLVNNAYYAMLSEDLVAVPLFLYTNLTAPTITGRYTGKEGTYEVIIYGKSVTSTDYFLRTYGAEQVDPITILKYDEPTPLGSKGLFISFPEDIDNYDDTSWKVVIPNTKGSSYLDNYNNYVNAVDARDRAIADAKENLESTNGSSILTAELQKAEAQVQKILADISERIIKAPFSGLITDINVKVGETASSNQVAVKMISSGAYQLESYVPEIYISLVTVGDEATVSLDAYGEGKIFTANVISVDPAETIRDGVPMYRVRLQLSADAEEVRSGMTANVVITTEKKDNTISIPQGVVFAKNGKKFVNIRERGNLSEREVQTGLVSSLGKIEIISGLYEGEMVVIPQP